MKPRSIIFALSAALLLGWTSAPRLHAQDEDSSDNAPSAHIGQPAPQPLGQGPGYRAKHPHLPDDQVIVMGDNHVEAGHEVGDAVAIMSPLTVDGHVLRDAVAVMGNNTINGTVDHDVVCVMGDLTLGPNAYVGHDVVCVLGTLHRDPGATVGGSVVHQGSFGPHLDSWWLHGLRHGRMLPFMPGLAWIWILNVMVIGLYVLMAVLFPNAMRRTGNQLAERPIQVLFSGFLAILALPILFVLLCITLIGIPVAIFLLPLALALLVLFGKGSIYGLVGRGLTGDRAPMPLAVFLGAVATLVFLLCPYIGIFIYLIVTYLGFGCALTALLNARKAPVPAAPPVFPYSPPPVAPAPSSVYPSPVIIPPPPAAETVPPAFDAPLPPPASPLPPPGFSTEPPLTPGAAAWQSPRPAATYGSAVPPMPPMPPTLPLDATLPRANFWKRTGAMAIDAALVGVASEFLTKPLDHSAGFFLFLLAAYAAVMWKVKGTTVGGLICHLQVVRVDGRPIDWPTAIVRALGCYVSLIPLGLGFIWVAFDPERQSWHDKLAGTTVVISVTRRSLV
jgi:uncharacterized RDD family membrane protein YckC